MRNSAHPLHDAVYSGELHTCRKILADGVDVNMKWDGETALHALARKWDWEEEDQEIYRLLVANGAHVNTPDYHGRSPLHLAIESESFGAMKSLIEDGAELHKTTEMFVQVVEQDEGSRTRICSPVPRGVDGEFVIVVPSALDLGNAHYPDYFPRLVAECQAAELSKAGPSWSPSSADAEALMQPSLHPDHEASTQQRSRRL